MKNWINLHIYYHADQNRLIREAIFPLVANLYREMAVRRFFFVRYELGGSHIRLRLESAANELAEVRASAQSELERFLAAVPSGTSVKREQIEKINRMLLATDPNECDASIYEDNTIREFPFRPEVARYGGQALLPYAFDLFTFTTAESLALIHDAALLTRGEAVTRSIRALIRASLALASTYEDLARIWRPSEHRLPALDASEQERQARRRLEELAWAEISNNDETWRRWSAAGSSLRQALAPVSDETQANIVRSQMHMFANRLDISNAVERGLGALMAEVFEARCRDWQLPKIVRCADWLAASCRNAFDRVSETNAPQTPRNFEMQVQTLERA